MLTATAWQTLYDNYPSQGTNTLWLDTGNYNFAPQVVAPKYMQTRFYRILDEGPDSLLSDEPSVQIDVLTNNTIVSGQLVFTVTAATDQPGLHGTILYVDGQEMQDADSTTNYAIGATNYETDTYSINTCEWLNGTHLLFASTEATSQYSSQENGGAVLTGHGVSPYPPGGIAQVELTDFQVFYYVSTMLPYSKHSPSKMHIRPMIEFLATFKSKQGETTEGGLFVPLTESQ